MQHKSLHSCWNPKRPLRATNVECLEHEAVRKYFRIYFNLFSPTLIFKSFCNMECSYPQLVKIWKFKYDTI